LIDWLGESLWLPVELAKEGKLVADVCFNAQQNGVAVL
jgi:hypothetical protein